MGADYIPTSDAGLLSWSNNFSTKITATPTAYGLTAANATAYAAAQSAYATSYAAAINPSTRGPLAVNNKNVARASLVSVSRHMAMQVQGTMTVTSSQKLELGLNPRTTFPSPIPVPMQAGMEVLKVSGNVVRVRAYNPADPTRRAKPDGVSSITVMSYVGASAPAADGPWYFQGTTTRPTFDVAFVGESAVAGAKVWLTCFFANPRGLSGQACPPISTNLQSGEVVAA